MDILILLFILYMGLEFLTLMLALSIIDYDQIPKSERISILKLAVDIRKGVKKDKSLPIKKTASTSALSFLNTLRIIFSALFLFFFVLLVSMVFITAFGGSQRGSQ